jgi:uncharacterized protein (DUF362 family)
MKRRDFIKNSIATGIATSLTMPLFYINKTQAYPKYDKMYDLVAIKGGEPEIMFDKAISQLGGMSNFVKKNQTVVVKPNIGWAVGPERGGNTNPKLVKRIIEHCYRAGAKKVYVFDNTCDEWTKCYHESGIKQAASDANALIVSGNSEKYYHDVDIPRGEILKKTKVHELILQSDVFINVPVLKNHGSANMTISIKNLMGVVWDRSYWHRNNLHQCIADYATFHRKPDLNIVDAYRVMMQNGPRGVSVHDTKIYKTQIISADMLAADTAATKIFGREPADIPYMKKAETMGVGTMNLENLSISRLNM